jgi:5-methylcytosine-specific restriction endonuclease McrA
MLITSNYLTKINTTSKHCPKCGQYKEVSCFGDNKSRKDGHSCWCKSCTRSEAEKYRNKKSSDTQWVENQKRYVKEWASRNKESYTKKLYLFWEWCAKNKTPDDLRKKWKSWRDDNRDKVLAYKRNRRARELKAEGKIKEGEWSYLKNKYNNTCLACGKKEPEIKLSLDHVVPLIRGGKNLIDNSQPLCISCNSKKGTKIIDYRNIST